MADMKKRGLGRGLSVLIPVKPDDGPADAEHAIREVFLQYKEAIAKSRGETAASLVSEKTLGYFERMRVAALSMPASTAAAKARRCWCEK